MRVTTLQESRPLACRAVFAFVLLFVVDAAQGEGEETPAPVESIPVQPIADAPAEAPPVVRQAADRLDEIIVTAQRREEKVRDVPIAISVMSGDDLQKAAISTFDDMARLVPNVSFNSDFNSLYMRGIGTAELNVISEQAVSYVLDGVYVSRLDYLKPGFMDVERIEVLKGPQGTLYGRNATAGVINITYKQPTQGWESSVSLSGGQRSFRTAEGVLSGPITDDLTFRLAGNTHREDGPTLNLADDGNHLGDKELNQLRGKLHYDITDNVDASLTVNYFDYFIGVWAGNEAVVYPATLRGAVEVLDPTFEVGLDHRGSANMQNRSEGAGWMIPLQFKGEFWGQTLTSITSWTRLNDDQGGDIDGSAADLATLDADSRSHQWSQELRIVSPPGELEYVGGIFLYKSKMQTYVTVPLLTDPGLNTVSGVEAIAALNQLVGPVLGDVGSVGSLVFPNGAGDVLTGDMGVDVSSAGIFGQATWHVTDTLSLLLGGRFSQDKRTGKADVGSTGPLPIWTVLVLGGYTTERHATDQNFSPKVSVTWDVLDEATLYATYAEGYRSGSYNVAAFSQSDFEFEPEKSTTFETGVKTELLDGLVRFNFGGFHTTYDQYQLATFNGFSYNITNAKKVLSKGLESDVSAMLYPGLILSGGVGYNIAKFLDHKDGGCPTVDYFASGGLPPQGIAALPPKQTCDHSGKTLFRAPKWTGSLQLNYETPLFDWPVDFSAGAGTTYKGSELMDSDLDPLDGQGGYWLYNAQLGLKDSKGRWNVVVHGKNLADKTVKVFSGDIPLQAGAHWALANPPRTITATVEYFFWMGD